MSITRKKESTALKNHINSYLNGGVILNRCNIKFLQKLNFVDFDLAKIYRVKDINPLLARNRISHHIGFKNVSVANILGSNAFDDGFQNIPQVLDQFFGYDNSYLTRSIGLLNLDKDTFFLELSGSFKKEPICVTEFDDDKYIITENGTHRFIVLRLMYLSELSMAKTEEEKIKLKEKYTIPVDTCVIDKDASYAMNLISIFDVNGEVDYIFDEHDKNYRPTGNFVIVFLNGKKLKYTRDEFFDYVGMLDEKANYMCIFESIDDNDIYNLLSSYEKVSSFKLFVSRFCPRFLKFIIENNYEKICFETNDNYDYFENFGKKI